MKKSKPDETIEKLRGLLVIDKHSLDDEIERQPELFFEISEAAVLAAARRDFLKEEISRIDAELHAKHTRRLEKAGSKATVGAVDAAVKTDVKHTRAIERHISAKRKADLYQALKEAFSQRSYMLRDLASLAIAQYYERTSVSATNVAKDFKAHKNIERMADERKRRGKA